MGRTKPSLIDISPPVRAGMPRWPGDPPVSIEWLEDMRAGGAVNLSRITLGAHAGTHVDAPLHYLPAGRSIDKMPLDALVGPARVIEARGRADGSIAKEELEAKDIKRAERILLKTDNSLLWERPGPFRERFVHLSVAAARFLARKKIRAVGIDYLSVSGYMKDEARVHRALLEAGVWIIEGLDLSGARPGQYELICLPLRMEGLEAAPARALLRPLGR